MHFLNRTCFHPLDHEDEAVDTDVDLVSQAGTEDGEGDIDDEGLISLSGGFWLREGDGAEHHIEHTRSSGRCLLVYKRVEDERIITREIYH